MSNDVKIANQISARLSLRNPQEKSLQILCDVLEQMGLSKDADLNRWIEILKHQYPSVKKFERAFPSLCFALATGVGKTRLMGAMITWLYLTGRSRHFFVLAPNLTIYEKLKKDFLMGSPKYVFQGIPELVQTPPIIITGDDYEDGRGVRLDYAVAETMTGDLFVGEDAPHINIFNVSKINAKDNKIGANKSNDPKMRRLQEYIGDSYFNYLADLPDLVVIMDEAHRYYASAGAKALDDLKPVLGIELTATPKHVGTKKQEFTNIIYHYPLASALNDGYVKTPAVATRKEFKPSEYSQERLEEIKLEDGIHHHEYVKTELASYANNTGEKLIRPFMLVVAHDTSHAESLKKKIEADSFFEGAYKGKVITVHSNQTGEESEETTQRLLSVEHDKDTEIVIHVNKLKEGWDVTNLYTIVPLRASASEILTEQTIGRGLRLPYGKRTKVEAVDRLTIIAHDRFQEIIDQANDKESIIKKTLYIGPGEENDIPEKKPKQIFVPSMVDYALGNKPVYLDNSSIGDRQATYDVSGSDQVDNYSLRNNVQTKEYTPAQKKIAELTVAIVQQEAKNLESSKQLTSEQVKQHIAQRVHQVAKELFVLKADNDNKVAEVYTHSVAQPTDQVEIFDSAFVDEIVSTVTEKIAEFTIDIPKIVVLPTRDVNYGFNDFDLIGLEHISLKPQSNEIIISNLETSQISTISWENDVVSEERLENYLVFYLMDHDEIDYDEHAGMLYKLSGQMVAHLKSYLSDVDTEGVLRSGGRILAEFIWSQIKQHMWTTPTDYVGSITQGFDVLKPTTFNFANDEEPRDFRAPIPAGQKSKIRKMLFTGFTRCCYPYQKFDSVDGELRLAQVLEQDQTVIKWMKPSPGQFRIEYLRGQNYEPDFVVETENQFLLMEPKNAKELEDLDVIAKAKAATRWCRYANEKAAKVGGKPWHYVLLPHDSITLSRSVDGLLEEFEYHD